MPKKIKEGLSCGYKFDPQDNRKRCDSCKHYRPLDSTKGICWEYEVVPYGGCKHFESK
jgi:hypothetical protein